ncbi:anthranilate phosphoribosyltransferase [Aciditerrimonas ferrireducens]|nr:anthranilate phosphoribosyltransferase [Aciditerrimonas ferrireducens]MCK4177327.1 anthranilate phosphoribosyltransferase [Aciditerrimonas ferrireducens]
MSAAPSMADLGGWPGVLGRLLARQDLSAEEAAVALGEVLRGEATPAQIAGFVVALRAKGESAEEMTGLVRAMLDHAEPLRLGVEVLDTCGTGGDRSASINVSTLAALVVAACGQPVCKHGGRAASSATGSADVLEALGVAIDLGPKGVEACVAEATIGFCFAPRFHPAMRHAAPVRRDLGVATVFNLLGPLANPARARLQLVGVNDPALAERMLAVLVANGARRAMVVHGADGLDELSTTGPSHALFYDRDAAPGGSTTALVVDPAALGLAPARLADLRGGDPATNARFAREVLAGAPGPRRDVVLLNAAAGLLVAGQVADLADGLARAAEAVDSGAAAATLDRLVEVSTREAAAGH